jgi:hypothetical protein
MARWFDELEGTGVALRTVRNERNIGAIRNIASCIAMASDRFVWTVGDDDAIDPARSASCSTRYERTRTWRC